MLAIAFIDTGRVVEKQFLNGAGHWHILPG
jgi:hypothetical protein